MNNCCQPSPTPSLQSSGSSVSSSPLWLNRVSTAWKVHWPIILLLAGTFLIRVVWMAWRNGWGEYVPMGDTGAYLNSVHYIRTGEAFGDYIRPPLSASYTLWPFVNILGDIWGLIVWHSLVSMTQILGAYLLSKYFTSIKTALLITFIVAFEPFMLIQYIGGANITFGSGLIMIGTWAVLTKRLNWLMFAVITLPLVSIPGIFTAAILFALVWWKNKDFTVARRIAVSAIVVFPLAFHYIWPLAPWNDRFTSEAQYWTGFGLANGNNSLILSSALQAWLAWLVLKFSKDIIIIRIAWMGLLYAPFSFFSLGSEPVDNLISVAGNITMYKVVIIIFGITIWQQGKQIKLKYVYAVFAGLLLINTIYIPIWATATHHRVTPEFLLEDRIYASRPVADMASYYRQAPVRYIQPETNKIFYRDRYLTKYELVEGETLIFFIEPLQRVADINDIIQTYRVIEGKLVLHE